MSLTDYNITIVQYMYNFFPLHVLVHDVLAAYFKSVCYIMLSRNQVSV